MYNKFVDKISEYINRERSLGKSDEQIKQEFLQVGWQQSQINQYFPESPPKRQLLIIATVSACVLLLLTVSTAGVYLIVKNKNNNIKPISPEETTATPESSVKEATANIVAFLQRDENPTLAENANSSWFTDPRFYDLTARKMLPADPVINSEKRTLESFGPWSPDGRYLPILFIYSSGQPLPLHFFDSVDQKARKIHTFSVEEDSKYLGLYSFIGTRSRWINNSQYVFYEDSAYLTISDRKVYALSSDGKISSVSGRAKIPGVTTVGNSRIIVTSTYSLDNADLPSSVSIKVDGKQIPTGAIKGKVVGLIGNQIVSIENLISRKIQDLYSLNTLDLDTLDLSSKIAIHLYDLSGTGVSSYQPNNDKWQFISAQIRPKKNTLIMLLRDKAFPPYVGRFVEIDPLNSTLRIIGQTQTASIFPGPAAFGYEFGVSSDGSWVIGYDVPASTLAAAISAWNIDSGEKLTICSKNCLTPEVYNPEQLSPR